MKTEIRYLLLAVFLVALSAPSVCRADSDSVNSTPTRGKRGVKPVNPDDPGKPNLSLIRGMCTVIEGPGNPFSGPCSNVVLILNDSSGKEVSRTRTSSKGDFEFSTPDRAKYFIDVGSHLYTFVSPKVPLTGGVRVEVRIQEK